MFSFVVFARCGSISAAALALSLLAGGAQARRLQDRDVRRTDRLCGNRRPRLARRRRDRGRCAQRQGRHIGPQGRGHSRRQPLRASGSGHRLSQDDQLRQRQCIRQRLCLCREFRGRPLVVRAETPMVLCSILPQQPDQVVWAFTTIPPPRFEVETRLDYLKNKTRSKKSACCTIPRLMPTRKAPRRRKRPQLRPRDRRQRAIQDRRRRFQRADSEDVRAGARAIIKIGLGGTTLTAAKNIKQLGLDMIMLTSLEDIAVFRPVAEVLGDKFFFVASPAQVYDALPASPLKTEIEKFLVPWRAKYNDRDPNWAGRGWDAVTLIAAATERRNPPTDRRYATRSKASTASRARPASTISRPAIIRASRKIRCCSRRSSMARSKW